MSNFSRRSLAAVAVLGALALVGCSKGGAKANTDDMTMGDPKAKIEMVEYASASCSHCAAFNNNVFPAFKAKYIDTGKVHYPFKEFLTPPAEVAAAGFLTARCAGKDKYFNVVDALFHAQEEMFTSGDMRGVLLRTDDDSGTGLNASLTYTFSSAGTYYVGVTSPGDGFGTSGSYKVQAFALTPGAVAPVSFTGTTGRHPDRRFRQRNLHRAARQRRDQRPGRHRHRQLQRQPLGLPAVQHRHQRDRDRYRAGARRH